MKKIMILLAISATSVIAAEPVVCTLAYTTAASANTTAPTTGTCNWVPRSVVLVQCSSEVFLDSTRIGVTTPVADSGDQSINFAVNPDPYIVPLDQNDQPIAVRGATAAGTCKFMVTKRVRP